MKEPQFSTGTAPQPLSEKTTHHEDHSTLSSTPYGTEDNDSVIHGNQSPVPLQSPPNTQASPSPVPPNGGILAWLQVAGSFCIFLNTWGIVNMYGGVVTGAGFGCLFLPGVTIVSQYFNTKKAFATGIASLGSSVGGVIYPIVWTQLEPKIGFGWATRVIGFILMATLILPLVVLRPLQYPHKRRSLLDLKSLLDVPYVLFGLGILFGYMGIYVVFFYIQLYALSNTDMSPYLAFYLLAIISAGSSLGRILPNFAADYVGTLNMQTTFAFASAVLSLSLIAIRNEKGILAFCVLYGFFTGTFVSLPAPTVASLSTNMASLGGRMSMAFMAAGIGSLVGSPIAGAILSTNGGNNWTMLQVWSGILLVLSGVSMLGARIAKVGIKVNSKA
ncbi:hypothetical protein MMC17_006242 [Xylographa soralifera]|nr:hypothetical protein [Xylographa soralifera]